MITAPSERRKATGMLPLAGGLSGDSPVPGLAAGVSLAGDDIATIVGIAAMAPSAADR
jgi:hypothetical protein